MKHVITVLALFLATFFVYAQVETQYRVATIAAMKTYSGTATKIIVTATNDEYLNIPGLTANETTIYAGAGTRKWKLVSSISRTGYLPIPKYVTDSTATISLINGKQSTLVSATNIKTVNGSSVLGSGDLVVTGSGSAAKADTLATVSYAQYTIDKEGSTYFARPGFKSALPLISNSDAYTVIQGAINNLTPSGSSGSGGGRIYVKAGSYPLTDELTFTGWESGGVPYSRIIFEGDGPSTQITQSTAGKSAIRIKNAIGIVVQNMSIIRSGSAKYAIFADSSGTSEISIYRGELNNLLIYGSSANYPSVLLSNFFELEAHDILIENTAGDGMELRNASSSVNYGNSHFSYIHSYASNSSPYAGLKITSSQSGVMNLLTFDHFECTHGYYSIYTDNAANCKFNFLDIEAVPYGIYLGGNSGNTNGFIFDGGYISSTIESIHTASTTANNSFKNMDLWGGSTVVPVNDLSNYARPNSFGFTLHNSSQTALIVFTNSATQYKYTTSSGVVVSNTGGALGVQVLAPTALVHIKAGTATAGTAPLKFTSGTLLTTPEAGATEFDGSHFYGTVGSTRYQLDQQSGGSGSVTSFGKTDNYGITSSVANSTTTPVHTIGVDTIAMSTRAWRQKGIDSVQANVNALPLSSDYIIEKIGSTTYARPRSSSGFPAYSGTDAYTVIQAAITQLNDSGSIYISRGQYNLSDELKIHGIGSGFKTLKIKGSGFSTYLAQNTAGKNAIVIDNIAGVDIEDMKIYSDTRSAILLDSTGANTEVSVNHSKFINLHLIAGSSAYPAFYAKNFWFTEFNDIYAVNLAGDAIWLENASNANTNYGNSHFGKIVVDHATTTGFAGMRIKIGTNTNHGNLDASIFDAWYDVNGGDYSIYVTTAFDIHFKYVDMEGFTHPIYLGASGGATEGFSFDGGAIITNSNDTTISVRGNSSGGNTFSGLNIIGDATITPVYDNVPANGDYPNQYDLIIGQTVDDSKISIAWPSHTNLITRSKANGTKNVIAGAVIIPNIPTTSAGTPDVITRNTTTGAVEKKVVSGTGNVALTTSPTLTGTPLAPTASTGTNTTQIATTAFVLANQTFQSKCESAANLSPADATTYYFGPMWNNNGAATIAGNRQFAVPVNCTLIGYEIGTWSVSSPTSETSTVSVRINNTTDVQLSNAVTYGASQAVTGFGSMALSTNLNAGDKYEIKWLTPTWATNPTASNMTVVLYFITR